MFILVIFLKNGWNSDQNYLIKGNLSFILYN